MPEECFVQILLCLCDAADLLMVGTSCKAWRNTSCSSDAWQLAFIRTWSRRQKPSFVRDLWSKLLAKGLVEAAILDMTASSSHFMNCREQDYSVHVSPNSNATWYSCFHCAALDMKTRRAPTIDELCYDLHFDDKVCQNFPRFWSLSGGKELEGILDEVQFHPDGNITTCDEYTWNWRWLEAESAGKAAKTRGVHVDLEMVGSIVGLIMLTCYEEQSLSIPFQFYRSADAGFVLMSPHGVKLCSREMTLQAHISRRYGAPLTHRLGFI